MKKQFKKAMTVLASTAMLASTVAMGLAASYPEPFVGNSAVVVGSGADGADGIAAGNIVNNLNAANVGAASSSGPTTVTGGESVRLDKSSNRLNFGDALNGPFGATVDDDDFPELLADGEYQAEDSDDFSYEQKITLGAPVLSHFRDSDYEDLIGSEDRTPAVGINITDGDHILNYTLDFLDQVDSTVTSGDFTDIEGSDLPLLGKLFYVSDAKNGTSTATAGKFTLLDSASNSLISEGETVTLNVGGESYTVSIDFVDSSETILTINGEKTNSLNEGETYKLSSGSYIAIRDILYSSKDTGISSVDFSVGSGRLEITSGNDVEINDESISDLKAWVFKGTGDTIDKIEIEWRAEDDMFITPESEINLPGFGGIKLSMGDLVRNEEELITVTNDGDDSIVLEVPVKDGKAELNLLYANSTGDIVGLGKSATERLLTVENNVSTATFQRKLDGAEYHENVVFSYNSSSDAESYVLSFTTNEDTSAGRNETTIKNEITKETWSDRKENDVFNLGDVQFTIGAIVDNSTDEWVTLSWTIADGMSIDRVYSDGGLMIQLPWEDVNQTTSQGAIFFSSTDTQVAGHSSDSYDIILQGEDKDDDLESGTVFNITVNDNSDDELELTNIDGSGTGGPRGKELQNSNTYETYILDDVAPRLLHYTNGDQDYVEIFYPKEESETYAEVFIASTDAVITGGSTSTGVMSITDDAVATAAGKNLIVVGGSAINSVAAELLGGAYSGDAFTAQTGVAAGQFLIQSFTRSGNTALLVAGYNAADTTKAATYLLNTDNDVDTSAGTKYVGSDATSANLVVA